MLIDRLNCAFFVASARDFYTWAVLFEYLKYETIEQSNVNNNLFENLFNQECFISFLKLSYAINRNIKQI